MTKPVYIYGLIDPRDNLIHYVGKTNNPIKRMGAHLRDCSAIPKAMWVMALAAREMLPRMEILEVVTGDWQVSEREWIRRGFAEGWPLTNVCEGGAGLSFDDILDKNIKDFWPLAGKDVFIDGKPLSLEDVLSMETGAKLDILCSAAIASIEEARPKLARL